MSRNRTISSPQRIRQMLEFWNCKNVSIQIHHAYGNYYRITAKHKDKIVVLVDKFHSLIANIHAAGREVLSMRNCPYCGHSMESV
jgi:hypothetical protein